jgi:hypothetical protein
MKKRKILMSVIFLFFLFTAYTQKFVGQDKKDFFYFVTAGFGVGKGQKVGVSSTTNPTNIGLNLNLECSIQKNNWLFSCGYRIIPDFEIVNRTKGKNSIKSSEFTLGRALKNDLLSLSISTGISKIIFKKQDGLTKIYTTDEWFLNEYREYNLITESQLGIPISIKIFLVPLQYYGTGLEFYANINKQANFFCFSFISEFGKLRNKMKAINK